MMEIAKAFEKADPVSVQNEADIYKISDSRTPKWNDAEKAGYGKQDINSIYTVSESKEPPWALSELKQSLTGEDREKIKQETGWSDEIVDATKTKEEYEIYKNAGLKEVEINGKPCLIRTDIDLEQKDELERTNKDRMEQGLAPLDKKGNSIELHHIGQKFDSPLAELTSEEHRGKGNDAILHDKIKESEIDRRVFQKEKEEHWEIRVKEEA